MGATVFLWGPLARKAEADVGPVLARLAQSDAHIHTKAARRAHEIGRNAESETLTHVGRVDGGVDGRLPTIGVGDRAP